MFAQIGIGLNVTNMMWLVVILVIIIVASIMIFSRKRKH